MYSIRLPQRGRIGALGASIQAEGVALPLVHTHLGPAEIAVLLGSQGQPALLLTLDQYQIDTLGSRGPDAPAHRAAGQGQGPATSVQLFHDRLLPCSRSGASDH